MVKRKAREEFYRMLRELLSSDPSLKEEIDRAIKMFVNNHNDTRLRDHALNKRMKGWRAFSVNEDVRIVYKVTGKNNVEFLAIGGHRKVYGKVNDNVGQL